MSPNSTVTLSVSTAALGGSGYDAAIMGRQYQRIVMLRPHWQPTAAEVAAFEDYVNIHWRPRLDRDATIKII